MLATQDENGKPFLIPNGMDISNDGKIYFSNTSHKSPYTINYGRKIILEMKPLGGLYCYDPKTRKVKTLIDGTWFGNDVVLSKDESFVLMIETAKYRVLRYWLKGEKAGKTDIFKDNLPGFPNGISIRRMGVIGWVFQQKGVVMPEAGAVKENNGYLYIGGDVVPHIGKLTINKEKL